MFAAYSTAAQQQQSQSRRVYEARVLSEPSALAAKDSYVCVRVLVGRVRARHAGVHAAVDDDEDEDEEEGEMMPVITTGASIHAQLLVGTHAADDSDRDDDDDDDDGDQSDGDHDDGEDVESREHDGDHARASGRRSLRARGRRVAAARDARPRSTGGRAPRSATASREGGGSGALSDDGVEELSGAFLDGKWGIGALQADEEASVRERYDAFSVLLVYVRVSTLSSAVGGRSFAVRLFFHEPSGGVPWLLVRTGFFMVLSKAALSARRRHEREHAAEIDARGGGVSGVAAPQRVGAGGAAKRANADESLISAVRTLMASLETDVSARPQGAAQQAAAQASRSLREGAAGGAASAAAATAATATPEQLRALEALRQMVVEDEATLVQLHKRVAVMRERQAYAKQQLVQMSSVLRNDALPLQVVERQVQSIIEATTARVRTWTAEQ